VKTIVQKFGGSSLATAEARETAVSRVLESRTHGFMPVVVCSALGRSPDPYATDTLLSVLGPSRGGPNRDLLLSCGESIGSAVFAELLQRIGGAPAQAMTGGQAGIVTDESFGDARIVHVDPANVRRALAAGVIPVVTGFQGASASGAVTTLGRGGSDLTAIALGSALGSELVEIYTDVSGVMSGDPRRIAGARTIEHVSWGEMVELAADGAKVVHAKAAELARVTETPYVVKGLRSNVGSLITGEAPVDRTRPVTGITALRDIVFVRVIQGGAPGDLAANHEVLLTLFGRIAERGISIDMINVNNAGFFFIVDQPDFGELEIALSAGLNVAFRPRKHCAKISIVGAGMRGTSGVMYGVVRAVAKAGVEIIHSTDSNITISILVPEDDAERAMQALHDHFHLGAAAAQSTPAEMTAGGLR